NRHACSAVVIDPFEFERIDRIGMSALRSLVITAALPFPPVSGRDLRNWQNVCGLASLGQVGVFGFRPNASDSHGQPPIDLAFWRRPGRAALTRSAPTRTFNALAWPFDPSGHPADSNYCEDDACEITEAMISFDPHLVIIEGLWLYRYIGVVK